MSPTLRERPGQPRGDPEAVPERAARAAVLGMTRRPGRRGAREQKGEVQEVRMTRAATELPGAREQPEVVELRAARVRPEVVELQAARVRPEVVELPGAQMREWRGVLAKVAVSMRVRTHRRMPSRMLQPTRLRMLRQTGLRMWVVMV